ncbi:MAG: winged helix-turn-helix transcriptional regulator [Candidatus Methanoperedens sp.]
MKQNVPAITVLLFFLLIVPATAANDDVIVESGYKVPAAGERHDPIPISWWQFQFFLIIGQLSLMPVETITGAKILTYLGYRSVTGNNLLGNSTRLKILDYIKKNPGTSFCVISKETYVNRGTLSYHLQILEMYDTIMVNRKRGYAKYFENHGKFNYDEQIILQYLKKDIPRKIIKILIEHPGVSRKDISSTIGISEQAVSWYMKPLRTDGIVESETEGQLFNRYYVSTGAVTIILNLLQNESIGLNLNRN